MAQAKMRPIQDLRDRILDLQSDLKELEDRHKRAAQVRDLEAFTSGEALYLRFKGGTVQLFDGAGLNIVPVLRDIAGAVNASFMVLKDLVG